MKQLGLLCVLVFTSMSQAQMQVVARNSTVSYDFLYGYAGDIRTGLDVQADNSLLPAGGADLTSFSTGGGYYPPTDHTWSATVTWGVAHGYSITGGLGAASRITSSGLTVLTSVESGATSGVNSVNPGNVLTIDFNIAVMQELHLFGALEQNGPGNRNGSGVNLYAANGAGGWGLIYLTTLQNASFDVVRLFQPGLYRIEAGAGAMAGQNESTHAAWTYTLEMVPAPSGAAVLALGGMGLAARRRKR